MKRIVEVTDAAGFESAMGEQIVVLCGIYIYAGTLIGVASDHLELADAVLVYDTGEWDAARWKDAQPLPGQVWRVMLAAIESWGAGKQS